MFQKQGFLFHEMSIRAHFLHICNFDEEKQKEIEYQMQQYQHIPLIYITQDTKQQETQNNDIIRKNWYKMVIIQSEVKHRYAKPIQKAYNITFYSIEILVINELVIKDSSASECYGIDIPNIVHIQFPCLKDLTIISRQSLRSIQSLQSLNAPFLERIMLISKSITQISALRKCHFPQLRQIDITLCSVQQFGSLFQLATGNLTNVILLLIHTNNSLFKINPKCNLLLIQRKGFRQSRKQSCYQKLKQKYYKLKRKPKIV